MIQVVYSPTDQDLSVETTDDAGRVRRTGVTHRFGMNIRFQGVPGESAFPQGYIWNL